MARYQYETSPRKIKTDYEPVKKKTIEKSSYKKAKPVKKNKTKMKTNHKIKIVLFILLGFIAFFTISYRNAIIDSKYAKIKSLRADLATVEKQNEQLQATIESRLNLKTIQQEAEEQLGMKKLSNNQIKYVNLPKTDYVEAGSEEVKLEDDNFLKQIIKFIEKLIK